MDSRTKHPNQTNENENMNEIFFLENTLWLKEFQFILKIFFERQTDIHVPVLFGNALLWTVIFFHKYL